MSVIDDISTRVSQHNTTLQYILSSHQLDTRQEFAVLIYNSYIITIMKVVSSTYTFAINLANTAFNNAQNSTNTSSMKMFSHGIIYTVFYACVYLRNMYVTLTQLIKDIPAVAT